MRNRSRPRRLQATARVEVRAAEGRTAEAQGRAVEVLAFTGEPLRLEDFEVPVIVDLASVNLATQAVPLLYNHAPDVDCVVGRTHAIRTDGRQLTAAGRVWGHNDRSRAVLDAAAVGHEWQASIGADPARLEELPAGSSVQLNGREYTGPALISHGTVIREISFVVIGADRHTRAILARAGIPLKGTAMNPTFEEWLASLGFQDPAALDPTQAANLKLLYQEQYPEGEPSDPAPTDDPPADPAPTDPAPVPEPVEGGARRLPIRAGRPAPARTPAVDPVAEVRRAVAAETERIAGVRRICAGAHSQIEAQAIREGWTSDRTELAVLRAGRPAVNVVTGAGANVDPFDLIGAALMQATRAPRIEASYSPQVLDAAHRTYRGRIGLQEAILAAATAGGYHFRGSLRGDLPAMFRAAFSTSSLPGILSNLANKFLLAGFMAVDQTWAMIAARRSVPDFKTATSYRLNGGFTFDKVGPGGELKHGKVSEDSYTNRAESYGKLFGVSRQDLINDDLGALTALPQRIGRGAALTLNSVFWTAFLDDAAFFPTDDSNKNYISGATTALSAAGLTAAEKKFLDQKDPDNNPLGILPAVLLVPTGLKRTAMELMSSSTFVAGGAASGSQIPSANTWQGTYQVGVTPYLTNATAWWLLANPSDLAVIEVAFLNGVEAPTVETAEADFDTLGIAMRGYFDFGVAKQEYRAGVKSKGAA
jgi:hypothetical protein